MQPVKVGLIKKGRLGGGEINEREAGGLKLINATIYDRLLIPEVQALQAEDPQFKVFGDIWVNCINNLGHGNRTISPFQCMATFDEATGKWCGLEEYHPQKCEHATNLVSGYSLVYSVFERVGIGIFKE